jgi:hypothetical protein
VTTGHKIWVRLVCITSSKSISNRNATTGIYDNRAITVIQTLKKKNETANNGSVSHKVMIALPEWPLFFALPKWLWF